MYLMVVLCIALEIYVSLLFMIIYPPVYYYRYLFIQYRERVVGGSTRVAPVVEDCDQY